MRIRDLKEAGVDRMAFYDVVDPEGYDHKEQAGSSGSSGEQRMWQVSFNMAQAHANGWQLEWPGSDT